MSRERQVTVEHERGADEYSGRDVCVRVQATSSTSVELYLTEGEARQLLRGLLRAPGFDDATAAIARVRARLGDILPDWSDSGVIAVADILAALDGAPEPEAERDAALAAVERVTAERDSAMARIAKAWELHEPFTWSFGYGPVQTCKWCADHGVPQDVASWPCPTVAALDGGR